MEDKTKFLTTGYDIVVFDCDSTLTEIEGIDLLAKKRGKEKEVKALTEQAMNGRVKFEEIFSERLSLIKPQKGDLEWLYEQYIKHQVEDAKDVIKLLKEAGKEVYVVTGGYEYPVKKFAVYLGVLKENVFAVELKFDESGSYLGYNAKNVLTYNHGKRKVLQKIAKRGSVIFVGDGATDLEAQDVVDLMVGFGGVVSRPIVRKKADFFINLETLSPVLVLAQGVKQGSKLC